MGKSLSRPQNDNDEAAESIMLWPVKRLEPTTNVNRAAEAVTNHAYGSKFTGDWVLHDTSRPNTYIGPW